MKTATAGASAAFIAVGAAAVVGITKAIDATVHLAREVVQLQRVTGQSAESASALIAVGASFGVTVDQMGVTFGLLDKNVANNSTKLKQYGLNLRDAQGQMLPFDKQLAILADKFVALPTAQDRAAFAMNLFGRSGKTMIPILKQGSAGLEEMKLKARDLGVVMGQDTVDSALKLSRAEREFGESIKGAAVSIGTSFLPVATELVTWVTGAVEAFTRLPSFIKSGTLAFVALTGGILAVVKVAALFNGIWAPLVKGLAAGVVAVYQYVGGLVILAQSEGIAAAASEALSAALTTIMGPAGEVLVALGEVGLGAIKAANAVDSLGTQLGRAAEGHVHYSDAEELAARAGISLAEATKILTAAQKKSADASSEATQALQAQRTAEQALSGGLLGLVASLQQVRENQAAVNDLRKKGKTGTAEFRAAELTLLQSQLSLNGGFKDYIRNLNTARVPQREAVAHVLALGRQAGLTAAETRNVLAPAIQLITDKYKKVPKEVKTKVTADDQASPKIDHLLAKLKVLGALQGLHIAISAGLSGLPGGLASGGVIKAAQGFITQGPTLLTGESSTPTFAGRGAESVIPFDHRGIGILSQALEKAGAGGHGRLLLVEGRLSIDERGHTFIRGLAREEIDDQSTHDHNLSSMR